MVTLTIFRIKDGITDPDQVIRDRDQLQDTEVRLRRKHLGVLYFRRVTREMPRWMSYFDGATDLDPTSLSTSSVAAVLLLTHRKVLYALTFGHGRFLLNDGVLEDRFGLRVTLNSVDPSQLRSIDHKRLDAVPRHTREQLARAGGVTQFGLDVERDLLRAVTGKPSNSVHGHRLSGSAQLTVVADLPLSELPSYLEMYEQLARDSAYKTHFPWVDNISQISDPTRSRELDELLVEKLKRGRAQAWLAPPDVMDWSVTAGFRYDARKSAKVYPDLDFADYFAERGSTADMTTVRLDADRVYLVLTDEDAGAQSWPVRKCIVAELTSTGNRFVLSEGTWYQVDKAFADSIESAVKAIKKATISFPRCTSSNEGAYNEYVAKRHPDLILMDRRLVRCAGRGQIEICDLYSRERHLVHVKRYGASSTLSHLFAQGTVSAELLVSEANVRSEFQSKLPSSHHWGDPQNPLTPGDFEVCYAIISQGGKALSLPFFSKVNLRAAVRFLGGLGFRVSLAEVPS